MTYETDDTLFEYVYTQDSLCALIEYHDPFQCAVLTPAERRQADGAAPALTGADTDSWCEEFGA